MLRSLCTLSALFAVLATVRASGEIQICLKDKDIELVGGDGPNAKRHTTAEGCWTTDAGRPGQGDHTDEFDGNVWDHSKWIFHHDGKTVNCQAIGKPGDGAVPTFVFSKGDSYMKPCGERNGVTMHCGEPDPKLMATC